jgi:DNA-binding SARP family transcriptional activator/tetratricopeptide (TPR) repeat protein
VLGPLWVGRGGAEVGITAPLLRLLLGLLALQPDRVVSREEIIDVLWGERPPRTCAALVHHYVRQVRGMLEPDRRPGTASRSLVSERSGYRLVMDRDQIDVARFDDLVVAAGRARAAGDLVTALERYGQALACWRGPALADAPPQLRLHPATTAAAQRRIAAALAYADLAIDLGHPGPACDALRLMIDTEPLHEGLHARLMLALAGCGEPAAALQVFAGLRARLADELGIAPGAEISAAHLQVIGEAPTRPSPGVVTPAQLPADVAAFTGRDAYLRRMDGLLAQDGAGMVVAVIAGTAGVGKTSLAVRWAYRLRHRFPDGQLHVNLRGHALAPPVAPIEALTGFVAALGVPADRIPSDTEQAAALYRSLLADRRTLVLLDNAHSAEQVRPLLPAGAGCLVVVTSRNRLGGLLARDGAHLVDLDVLTPGEAATLLARVLGTERTTAQPAAAAELAHLCGHLPLALRIAAANLASRPQHTIASYAAQLRADRLSTLQIDQADTAVRAAFDLSYTALPAGTRDMFRLIGLVPGPDVTAEAAAALADLTTAQAAALLDQLADAHLIEETAPGRYSCHDLLRLYAVERLHHHPEPEWRPARHRLLTWYLDQVRAAGQRMYPHYVRLPAEPAPPAARAVPATDRFPDAARAGSWLDAELANLVAAITHAAEHGPRPTAWRLADALRGYFHLRMHTPLWRQVAEAGLRAARADGDGDGQAEAATRLSLADLHWRRSEHRTAIHHATRAAALAHDAGWLPGEGSCLGTLGFLHLERGQLERACEHINRALAICRRTGNLGGAAVNLGNLGEVCVAQGRLQLAAQHNTHALALDQQTGSRQLQANHLANLAEIHHTQGNIDDALRHATLALTMHREIGDRTFEPKTLQRLALIQQSAGQPDTALQTARLALTLARDTGHRRFEIYALNTLATIHHHLGDHQRTADYHQQALRLAQETGHRYAQAEAHIGLAAVHHDQGHHDEAATHVRHALTITRQAGFRLLEGHALTNLAAIHLSLNHTHRAQDLAQKALAIHLETGHRPGAEHTVHLLEKIAPTTRAS